MYFYGFIGNLRQKCNDEIMSRIDDLKILLNNFFNRRRAKERKMKRVFQWTRYLEWRDLAPEEKLSVKRFLLVPLFAYLIIQIFNQNFILIVLFLIGYVLYKKFKKGGLIKNKTDHFSRKTPP